MQLIIAEKPSLGRNIVAAIQSDGKQKLSRRDGYYAGEKYLVTWAFGHLFSLCDIEAYNPNPRKDGRWCMDNLPCFPKQFRFELRHAPQSTKADPGVQKQFDIIQTLCRRTDVDTIINAGDADREGEIIVRLCITHALTPEERLQKQMRRLWLPDQTPQTICQALQELPNDDAYDALANEGFARTYIDWLWGVNLTRYATLRTGHFLRVGRVIVPIVKAIYDRDMAIRHFVPDTYFSLRSIEKTNGETVELQSRLKFEKDPTLPKEEAEKRARNEAQLVCDRYNAGGAVVQNVKKKRDVLKPGKLFSLTKLQNALSKKYKMSMEQSLSILQKLYEAGYVTYPRTNSEYLATAEKSKVEKIIQGVQKWGYPITFKDGKQIFDDSKIESHSALTPTYKLPKKEALSEDEKKVYGMILRRFVAVFCAQNCVVQRTEMTIDVCGGKAPNGERFVLRGMVILEKGWTKYDDYSGHDKVLPALNKGDVVNIAFKPVQKETSPPKHYTVETLNNYLKNPFRTDRAATPSKQNAKNDDPSLTQSSQPTATRDISSDQMSQNALPADIGNDQLLGDTEEIDDTEEYRAIFEGLELGTEATRTGIIDNARKSKYIQLKKDVYTILPEGETLITSLDRMGIVMDKYKTSELGRALKRVYRGEMRVEDSVLLAKNQIETIFSHYESTQPPEIDTNDGCMGDVIGTCPLCHKGEVRRTAFGYGCSEWKDGCKFTIHGIICDRVISKSNVQLLLANGKTSKIKGFVSKKSGKTFDAALVMDENGNVKFDFSS